MEILLERLKKIRKEKGISQKELSEVLNISHQAYNHYETGVRKPSLEVLISLADYFNVSTDYLLGRDKTPETNIDSSQYKTNELDEDEQDVLNALNKIKSKKNRMKALVRFEDIVEKMMNETSNEISLTKQLMTAEKRA